MLMTKSDERNELKVGMQPKRNSWFSSKFASKSARLEKEEQAKMEVAAVSSLSAKRSRLRVKTAQMQLAAVIAEDVAAYNAVFSVEAERMKRRHEEVAPDRNDPSTWKRPNLDKLKASILADWGNDPSAFRGKSGFPAFN